jgi:MFS family permease
MLGLMVVPGSVNAFTFAVFLQPVSTDLGISRSAMASGVLLMMAVTGIATPFIGSLIDRFGCRRLLLPGIPMFAGSIAALSLLENSAAVLYPLFACAGLLGALQSTVPYANVISRWFDHDRGTALSIAMTGFGFGALVLPQIVSWMIVTVGWRLAYVGLAGLILLLALLPAVLFVREPDATDHQPGENRAVSEPTGLAARDVFLGEWRFLAIGVACVLTMTSIYAMLGQAVAMLTEDGLSVALAAAAYSMSGLGVIVGRLACGWCIDRYNGPAVAFVFVVIPALGIGCLFCASAFLPAAAGAFLCGCGVGAQIGIVAFFVGRYFGLKSYGAVFGAIMGLTILSGGLGPFAGAALFDLFRSYQPTTVVCLISLGTASLLYLALGPYRFGPPKVHSQPKQIKPQPSAGNMATVGAANNPV